MTYTPPIAPIGLAFTGLILMGLVLVWKRVVDSEPSNWALVGLMGVSYLLAWVPTFAVVAYPVIAGWVTLTVVGLVTIAAALSWGT